MKKILLCVSLLSMFAAGFVGCSQKREGNHEQRKAMREALRSYRQMVYLDDLTDAEFVLFTDQVAGELEGTYPVYAGKVNDTYDTMSQFFNAILADTTDMSQLRQLQGQCANDLFEWVITEVDVIESVN